MDEDFSYDENRPILIHPTTEIRPLMKHYLDFTARIREGYIFTFNDVPLTDEDSSNSVRFSLLQNGAGHYEISRR